MKTLGKSDAQGYFSSSSPSLCTVSVRCFLPARLLGALTDRTPDTLQGTLSAFSAERGGNGSLALFTRTVPKRVTRDEKGRIVTLEAIRRTPVQGEAHRLSHVIADWYDPAGSARFAKQRLQFRASPLAHGRPPVVIDATEWGELLVLAKASYIQGVEASEDFPLGPRRTQCGQAIVFPLALEMHAAPVAEAPVWAQAHSEFAAYRARLQRLGHATRSLYSIPEPGKPWTWDFVWAYRRLKLGSLHRKETVPGAGQTPGAQVGDVSAQNWRLGNDYPYGYVFKSPLDAAREVQSDDWRGGIETETLREAELHALGWYAHLRSQGWVSWNGVTTHVGARIKLSDVFGTPHGLAKLPYLRESRRSVGIDDFVLRYQEHLLPGVQFEDAVGVGSYAADIHSTWNFDAQGKCAMPAYLNRDILPGPYTIPFRALTNRDVENLLVAGKTMAQTFFANSSTRVHPVEFASGTGSGVAAAYLARSGLSTRDLLANGEMSALRQLIGRYQPTVWPTGLLEGNRVSLAP